MLCLSVSINYLLEKTRRKKNYRQAPLTIVQQRIILECTPQEHGRITDEGFLHESYLYVY